MRARQLSLSLFASPLALLLATVASAVPAIGAPLEAGFGREASSQLPINYHCFATVAQDNGDGSRKDAVAVTEFSIGPRELSIGSIQLTPGSFPDASKFPKSSDLSKPFSLSIKISSLDNGTNFTNLTLETTFAVFVKGLGKRMVYLVSNDKRDGRAQTLRTYSELKLADGPLLSRRALKAEVRCNDEIPE